MTALDDSALLNALLTLADVLQTGLLRLLNALGLTDTVAGQPAWPFAARIATETLLIDRGLARQLAWALGCASLALALLIASAFWRRGRLPVWAIVLIGAAFVPWPPLVLVLSPAVPTSFHRSTTNFEAESVARGLALYTAHCASCHGSDGRGEGPMAASLPVWPPTLSAGLLWKRPEGELLWRVLHGMRDRSGVATMPGFAATLSPSDGWALLDGMKALSAGESVRREAVWAWPVRAPGVAVDCVEATSALDHWRGQRLRIVAVDGRQAAPREDPRLVTVLLRRAPGDKRAIDCAAEGPAAWAAYARVAGVAPEALAGTQFIVDRDGWLRALGRPGERGWSADSLLCRTDAPSDPARRASDADGLGALIASMDGDPVRIGRAGLPHANR